MDKLSHHWLAIEEAQCDGAIQCSSTKMGKVARDNPKKFDVSPESISTDTGLGRHGIQMGTRKQTSECKVRAMLIWTESTWESGASFTATEVCWVTT